MKHPLLRAVILLCCIALTLSGCRRGTAVTGSEGLPLPDGTVYGDTVQLLYCHADSLNPYTAETELNRRLCGLLYDPLIKLNNSFEPVYCLAEAVKNDGAACTVTLRQTAFTDGSSVTADDVIYSYNLARESATVYAAQLYEVASVRAADSRTVVFTLTRSDPYFINLLDFPIIKSGSVGRVDSDSVALPPIGCGRYILSNDGLSLQRSDSYYGKKGGIARIQLINAPDEESVAHYVEVGAADIYYTDVSDGSIVRMSGQKSDVNLNHLVYIGINDSVAGLDRQELRYAISSALDRSAVCQSAYYNNAVSAAGFFHPAFEAVRAVQTIKNTADIEIAIENLEKIGYNSSDNDGYRVNAAGKRVTLSLLVNSDNPARAAAARLIAGQLQAAGIEIRVDERSYEDYLSRLQSGSFQLYLGEVRLLNNMDVSAIALPGGSAAYGVGLAAEKAAGTAAAENPAPDDAAPDDAAEEEQTPPTLSDIIAGFYSGGSTVTDVATALLTEMPVIPVCFRVGLFFYSSDIVGAGAASQSDIYLSFEDYQIKK